MDKKKVMAIVGPTGIGKTSLAIHLAQRFNGEIISGDSMQVYRKMDIGTAKASSQERSQIQHYLIDIQEYDRPYNVRLFQEKCREAIQTIEKKGKIPIICGGTGLYLKAALYDYTFEENGEDSEYENWLKKKANSELVTLLKKEDPKSLEKIHPNNRKRLIRALMMAHSGTKKSERERQQQHEPIFDVLWIGLTMDREKLKERIDHRVEEMFDQGLVQEVQSLFSDPSSWKYTSFQGIGYKEFKNYFLQIMDADEVKEQIKIHTRQYAKRQMTWFRNQVPVCWFNREERNQIEDRIKEWLYE